MDLQRSEKDYLINPMKQINEEDGHSVHSDSVQGQQTLTERLNKYH